MLSFLPLQSVQCHPPMEFGGANGQRYWSSTGWLNAASNFLQTSFVPVLCYGIVKKKKIYN